MNTREYRYYTFQLDPPPKTMELFFCEDCGSVIGDTVTHDEWHARLISAVVSASMGINSVAIRGI